MPQCAICTGELPDGASTCPECGTPVAPPKPPVKKVPKTAAAAQIQEWLLRGVVVIVVGLLAAAVIFVGWSIASQGIQSGAP